MSRPAHHRHRRALTAFGFAFGIALLGCGGAARPGAAAPPPTCEAPTDTARALLVDWEPADRAALEAEVAGGVAVVRYDGCTLELLDDCRLDGEYLAADSSRSTGGFTVRDAAALRARLPLGEAALADELADGRSLTLRYVTAATAVARLSTRERGMLSGSCDRATHFVRSMVRGAYAITASGGGTPAGRIVRDGGDLDRCEDRETAADDAACAAVVQVALTPVTELSAGRDDLFEDLGRDVAGIANMEEALRALQEMAGAGPAPGGAVSGPPAPTGPLSELAEGIQALPDGGSDAWDQSVAPMLIAAYDKDASKRIDTIDEVAAIPCDVLATMDRSIRTGRGGAAALRTTYGFPGGYIWVGYALGFDEKIRRDADARFANCGL